MQRARSAGRGALAPLASLICAVTMFAAVLPLTAEPPEWNLEPDPSNESDPPARMSFRVLLERSPRMVTSAVGDRWVLVTNSSGDAPALWDLYRGRLVTRLRSDLPDHLAVLSPNGRFLAVQSSRTPVEVTVVSLRPARRLVQLNYENEFPAWMALTDAQQLLMLLVNSDSHAVRFVAYDVEQDQEAWQVRVRDGVDANGVALSAGQRYLAFAHWPDARDAGRVRIHNVSDGKLAGDLTVPPSELSADPHGLTFSRDGAKLSLGVRIAGDDWRVHTWNLATGALHATVRIDRDDYRDFGRIRAKNARRIEFVGERYGLLRGVLLYDWQQGVVVSEVNDADDWSDRLPWRVVGGEHMLVQRDAQSRRNRAVRTALQPERLDLARLAKLRDEAVAERKAAAAARREAARAERAERRREAERESPDMPALTEADLTGARDLGDMRGRTSAWRIEPDPAPEAMGELLPRPVAVTFKRRHTLHVARGGNGRVLAGPAVRARGNHPDPPVYQLLDFTGKTPPRKIELAIERSTELMAVSPDGTRALTVTDEHRMDVFDIDTGKHVVGWLGTELDGDASDRVRDAVFVDNQRVLIGAEPQSLSLWRFDGDEIDRPTLEWQWGNGAYEIVMSPGGRYAMIRANGLAFIEARTGRLVGRLEGLDALSGRLENAAWSADGKRLAAIAGRDPWTLNTWDVATGKRTNQWPLQRELHNAPIQWLGEDHLLVGRYLIDPKRGVAVWSYGQPGRHDGTVQHQQMDARLWYRHERGKQRTFVAVDAPHPQVKKAMSEGTPPEPLIGAGDRVAIKAKLDEDSRQRFIKRLRAQGIEVVNNAPTRLVSSINTEKTGTKKFRDMKGGETRDITLYTTERRIAWERNGQTLWEQTSKASTREYGGLVFVDEGESMWDKIGEAERKARKRPFSTGNIPALLYPQPEETVRGWSEVTAGRTVPLQH